VLVFHQVDKNKNGTLEKSELKTLLKRLHHESVRLSLKAHDPGQSIMTFSDIMTKLDLDSNGVIDVNEWSQELAKLPSLKILIQDNMDPETGLIFGL
jgi:hypothetical protein